jgi:hypothetical protein
MLAIILGLLFLLGMFYVKRRLDANDKRLDLLTDTIQTMAGIRMEEIEKESEGSESEESEESESESESDDESVVSTKNVLWTREDTPVLQWDRIAEINVPDEVEGQTTELKVLTLDEPEIKTIQLPKVTVSDDDVTEFDGFTLKELKEKVAEFDGPKLKTKKECIEFLKIKSKKEI